MHITAVANTADLIRAVQALDIFTDVTTYPPEATALGVTCTAPDGRIIEMAYNRYTNSIDWMDFDNAQQYAGTTYNNQGSVSPLQLVMFLNSWIAAIPSPELVITDTTTGESVITTVIDFPNDVERLLRLDPLNATTGTLIWELHDTLLTTPLDLDLVDTLCWQLSLNIDGLEQLA